MSRGLIIKGVGGFYYIETEGGIIRARGKGTLKNDGILLMVGDEVEYEEREDDDLITRVLPRKNHFSRPPIANLDMLVVVMAQSKPKANTLIIDKMLTIAEAQGVDSIICINKCDEGDPEEGLRLKEIYSVAYPTFLVSAKNGHNLEELLRAIEGKRVALAGPSGAGKSTLTNALIPSATMEVGSISEKTSRGKHTTRHVEMFHLGSGYLFDTPGFTSLDAGDEEERDLGELFPEIRKNMGKCRFDDCLHLKEPGCAVRRAVEEGEMSESRYESYVSMLEEVKNRRRF